MYTEYHIYYVGEFSLDLSVDKYEILYLHENLFIYSIRTSDVWRTFFQIYYTLLRFIS